MKPSLAGSICLGLLATLGPPAFAAEAPPAVPVDAFGETVEVRELILEVQALDRAGDPVPGLGPEAFTVEVGGVPAEVVAVREVGAPAAPEAGSVADGAARPAAAASSADPGVAADPLRLVVFVDNVHVSPVSRRRALSDLVAFLDSSLRPGDEVMVVTYDGRVEVRVPFTADLDRVRAALAAAEELTADRLFAGSEEQRVMEQIYEVQFMMLQGKADPCTLIEGIALNFATERYQGTERMIDGLGRFVDSLSGVGGRKAVLHVSDGIPLVPGRGAYEYVIELCNGIGAAKGVAAAVDLTLDPHDHTNSSKLGLDLQRFDLTTAWSALAARANRQNVTIYTFQASGLAEGTGADTTVRLGSLETASSRRQNEQDTLVLLARETGGRAVLNRNRLAPAFARIADELRHYYEVAVRPVAPLPTGRVLPVNVEVAAPAAEARHRRSVAFKTRQEEAADRVLAALLHEVTTGTSGLRAEVARREVLPGDRSRALVRIEIPLADLTLLPTGPSARGLFTVFLAAVDEEGRSTPVRQSTVPLSLPTRGLEAARRGVYRFDVAMDLRAGEHVVAVGVLDEVGGGISTVRSILRF